MKIPYHILQVSGDVVFAAQGANIVSFKSDGTRLSTWKHPGQFKPAPPIQEDKVSSSPPAKRRKVDGSEEQDQQDQESIGEVAQSTEAAPEAGKKPKSDKRPQNPGQRPDGCAIIQGLVATETGDYLVALTDSDKTIWVFEHDGAGCLKQLDPRVMPKRPSSITLTPDNQTILSADKFGDVYSLPLIPIFTNRADSKDGSTQPNAQPSMPEQNVPSPTLPQPQANETTVHMRRNLRALQDQKRQREQNQLALAKRAAEKDAMPQFEHTLLLGHVSMLTSILAATHGDRPYIITADRDEHIRVSRGIPQAHVIEGYCFSHEEFVSALCIPPSRPEILVSAGGGNALIVHDWKRGELLSHVDILGPVQKAIPDTCKLAVTSLYSWQERAQGGSVWVAVIVERVPVLFLLTLTGSNTLEHVQSVELPGNPLSIVRISDGGSPRLLVAIDPTDPASMPRPSNQSSSSLRILEQTSDASWLLSDTHFSETETSSTNEPEILVEALRDVLYSAESLRKQDHDALKSTTETVTEVAGQAGDDVEMGS